MGKYRVSVCLTVSDAHFGMLVFQDYCPRGLHVDPVTEACSASTSFLYDAENQIKDACMERQHTLGRTCSRQPHPQLPQL